MYYMNRSYQNALFVVFVCQWNHDKERVATIDDRGMTILWGLSLGSATLCLYTHPYQEGMCPGL